MRTAGYTLIELMLTVTLIGILAAVARPKLSLVIRKTQEARTKENLAAMRQALAHYYTDRDGKYPLDNLASLVAGNYLVKIPDKATPPYHPEGNSVSAGPLSAQTDSAGDWFYVNAPNDAAFGSVMVNCVHMTLGGAVWSSL